MSAPELTVVMPAFNEAEILETSVKSVVEGLRERGTPFELVIIENRRGWCRLRAVVTDAVRPGVVVSPKGRWSKLSGGRNVNWTTSDALADMAGQSTFHSNRIWLRRAEA